MMVHPHMGKELVPSVTVATFLHKNIIGHCKVLLVVAMATRSPVPWQHAVSTLILYDKIFSVSQGLQFRTFSGLRN